MEVQPLVLGGLQGPGAGAVLGGVGPVVGGRGQHPADRGVLHGAAAKSCKEEAAAVNFYLSLSNRTREEVGALKKNPAPVGLTPAARHLAAPHRQRGVDAGEQRLPLQVVPHVAVEAGGASGQQVEHRHLPEVRPLGQRAAQPED